MEEEEEEERTNDFDPTKERPMKMRLLNRLGVSIGWEDIGPIRDGDDFDELFSDENEELLASYEEACRSIFWAEEVRAAKSGRVAVILSRPDDNVGSHRQNGVDASTMMDELDHYAERKVVHLTTATAAKIEAAHLPLAHEKHEQNAAIVMSCLKVVEQASSLKHKFDELLAITCAIDSVLWRYRYHIGEPDYELFAELFTKGGVVYLECILSELWSVVLAHDNKALFIDERTRRIIVDDLLYHFSAPWIDDDPRFNLLITSARDVKLGYRLIRKTGIAPDETCPGSKVYGEWSGQFYAGTITSTAYDVHFDDGDDFRLLPYELYVNSADRRLFENEARKYRIANDAEQAQGSIVYRQWENGTFLRGRIAKVKSTPRDQPFSGQYTPPSNAAFDRKKTFRVIFENGDDIGDLEQSELRVPLDTAEQRSDNDEGKGDKDDAVDDDAGVIVEEALDSLVFDDDQRESDISIVRRRPAPGRQAADERPSVEAAEDACIKAETAMIEHSSRYGDIFARLQGIAEAQESHVTAENCVHLARALDELLCHSTFPFDLDNAKAAKVKRKKADFPVEWDILACDVKGCGKLLWDEDCWVTEDTKLDTAFCVSCYSNGKVPKSKRQGLHRVRSSVPRLFITSRVPHAKRRRSQDATATAIIVKREGNESYLLANEDPEYVPETGQVRMVSVTRGSVSPALQSLRRRLTNGLMSGILYQRSALLKYDVTSQTPYLVCLWFRFRDPESHGNKGHLCNFVVGDTVDRPVFFVNLQTKEVVRSLCELKDEALYCEDCFFLPSPHAHSELESVEAASEALAVKKEECIGSEAISKLGIGALVEARPSQRDKTFHKGTIVSLTWIGQIPRYSVEWDEDGSYTPRLPRAWIRERRAQE